MTKNKNKENKLKEMEERISNKAIQDKLFKAMDPLVLGLEEMKKSFVSVFGQKIGKNKITLEMDKFENKVLSNLKI